MAVTDLTGYTWVGNDTVLSDITSSTFNINFTCNNIEYSILKIQKVSGDPVKEVYYNTTRVAYYLSGIGSLLRWQNAAYKTIQITGGTDTTNATIIAWLEANGTLSTPQPTETKNIKIGQATPSGLFIGEDEVDAVYVGSTKVWEKTQEPSGETWLIDEEPDLDFMELDAEIDFISNNETYNRIYLTTNKPLKLVYYSSTSVDIYDEFGGWTNQAYRTVTFETAPTGDLLEWLQLNAVKQ